MARTPTRSPQVALTEDFDFVLCVGDDRSDEDMYQLLKSWHSRRCEAIDHEDDRAPDLYNVHIGPGATHAEFCLESVVELRKILRGMAATSLKDSRTRRR